MTDPDQAVVTVRMSTDVHARLIGQSKAEGRSINKICIDAILRYLPDSIPQLAVPEAPNRAQRKA